MTAPTISAQFLRHIANCVELTGQSTHALLARIGLTRADIDDADNFIALADFLSFIESCATLIRNPQFGLMAGRLVGSDAVGPLSLLFLSAPTLRHALNGFTRYFTLMQQGSRIGFAEERRLAIYEYGILDPTLGNRRQDAEYSISAMFNLAQKYCGGSLSLTEVRFEHERVGDLSRYEDYFQCDVFFGQERNALYFPESHLEVRGKVLSDSLYPIIDDYLARKASVEHPSTGLVNRLRALIASYPPGAIPQREALAQRLALSEETMARHLRAEGFSLRALVAERRMDAAAYLLRNTGQSVAEIAHGVGYTESASFIRRFQQHFGSSPARYRRG
ncbi:AraC family transcriptional regulator [Novosphingobium rosa]|uniref:AraC family transcriptional regulator n=1 Tax=Novosphingobium rosa TaxID=76978 RepID=UPI0008349121|nr:AraC family transcriptional regulator [Novosphingobium rosa]